MNLKTIKMLNILNKLKNTPKVTLKDLSNGLDVNSSYIWRILNGQVPISKKVIKRMENFNTTEQHIIEEDGQTFIIEFSIRNITNK